MISRWVSWAAEPGRCTRTDGNGQTSVRGGWAAGNVTDPGAFVIGAAAAGARVSAVLNADLVEEDVAEAERRLGDE